ncbi:MAG: ABC transporter permease [Planctomycetota bacterium]|jgi:putative ABC transport system permease protein
MSLGRLVLRHLWSHPVRSLLTVGAVAVAIFLFCFLRSIITSLDAAVTASASNRIITASAVSLFQNLPRSYRTTIETLEGVESVSPFTWFGGRYGDERSPQAQFGTDPEVLLRQYPEVIVSEAEKRAWFEDRQGALVGRDLADEYGWEVGDTIPVRPSIYPHVDDSEWTFNIRGIYESTRANVDQRTMYFHASYLEEAQELGIAEGPRGTSVYIVRLADGYAGAEVARRIDDYYTGGPQRTRTQTEAAFQGWIVGAILVAILFGVVNTMTLAARERTRSVGILKAVGFPDGVPSRLFLMEAVALVGVGAALGIGLALVAEGPTRRALATQIPNFSIAVETLLQAGLIAVGIALLAGLVPAWRARRLRPVEALRRGA